MPPRRSSVSFGRGLIWLSFCVILCALLAAVVHSGDSFPPGFPLASTLRPAATATGSDGHRKFPPALREAAVIPPAPPTPFYWKEPKEAKEPLPVDPNGGFLTFEPWNGGWNNRRHSIEIALVLAAALNRTLVLPPPMWVNQLKGHSGFEDFYELEALRRAVPTLTFTEFAPVMAAIQAEPAVAATQQRAEADEQKRLRLQMDASCGRHGGQQAQAMCQAFQAVRKSAAAFSDRTNYVSTVFVLPPAPADKRDLAAFTGNNRAHMPLPEAYFWRGRDAATGLSVGGGPRVLHFPQNLFMPWYTVLYYSSQAEFRQAARLVRDGLHLRRELVALAGRVVGLLGLRNYTAVHVRRQDFSIQYKSSYLDAELVARNAAKITLPGEFIYVSSDESDPSYYRKLAERFPGRLLRLSDFNNVLGVGSGAKSFWLPIVEQLICVYARVFMGTRLSTFSANIVRMRGYLASHHPDWPQSATSTLFTDTEYPSSEVVLPEDKPYAFSGQWLGAVWGREYPEAYAHIDDPST